ncbi:MAG: SGNH/GDSL hydrolase family protein [Muribaculaceae bacterium]|nr:SGNH/GDSL hydrolase family protein [Muribaculaceae bacterium]
MSKIFKNFFAIGLALISISISFAQKRDWARLDRYSEANKALGNPAPGEHRVVFLGNSITDFWDDKHPDFFKNNNYICRGISGQTTYQFLVRFREDVINLRPEIVVINAGTNDCAENTHPFNVDISLGNIMSMVELAKANNIKVILTSVLPSSTFNWIPEITDAADRIALLNARIKEYADANNIPFVDYYTSMVIGPERAINPTYSEDGVHPTEAGYDVMESIIVPAINNVLQINLTNDR